MEADHAKSLDIAANRTLTERNRITELLRDIDENKYVNLALTHFKRLRIATNDFCHYHNSIFWWYRPVRKNGNELCLK